MNRTIGGEMGILDRLKELPTLNEVTGGVGEQLTKIVAKIEIPDTLVLHDVLIDGAENQTSGPVSRFSTK